MKAFLLLSFSILMVDLMTSCVYNSEEELYPPVCDTTQVTYTLSVVPIISYHCYDCHSGNPSTSGYPLDTYEGVKAKVIDGTLLGTIRHEEGFSPMPDEAPKLPDCAIRTIELWIEDGYPNN